MKSSKKKGNTPHLLSKLFFAISLSAFCILLTTPLALAEIKTFIVEYSYWAGNDDTEDSSRILSHREVKKLLLDELVLYMESFEDIKKLHFSRDKLFALISGIASTEVIEEVWSGKIYWLKSKISADPKFVIKSIIDFLQDNHNVNELEETRRRSDKLMQENERLKNDLLTIRNENRHETVQTYHRNIKNLTATEWFEKGFFLINSSDYNGAVEAFNKSIDLDPTYSEAYVCRAIVYDKIGNNAQAIKDYKISARLGSKKAQDYLKSINIDW